MKTENAFKLIIKEEQNRFFDPNKMNNGGGYHQPLYVFKYNGKEGVFSDRDQGDFGYDYFLEWDGVRAEKDWSEFSSDNLEHVELLKEIQELTSYTVLTKEDYI